MIEYELEYEPQGEVLEAYHHCRDLRQFIRGPLGSGKTIASCNKIFDLICEMPADENGERRSRWAAVRNTYSDLTTTTVKDWLEVCGEELGLFRMGNKEPPNQRVEFSLEDGTVVKAEMYFIALDRPEHVKKLRGMQLTGGWANEAKELPFAVIQMLFGRCGRYPRRVDVPDFWYGIIGDTNSPDDEHWFYELAEEERPEGWTFFRQPGGVIKVDGVWVENPEAENLANLPESYYANQVAGNDEDWINVNLGNNYGSVSDGKPVYENSWNDQLHVGPTAPITGKTIYVGWDFGLTPAAIITQQTARGQLQILGEIIGDNIGVRQFAEGFVLPVLNTEYRDHDIVHIGDPAGGNRAENDETTVYSELEELGITMEPAPSNNPLKRWEAVRWWLSQLRDGKPVFILNAACKVLRKGFNGGYRLRRMQVSGEARFSEKADKNRFSHPHDALQYVCLYLRGEVTEKKTKPMNTLPPRSKHAGTVGGWMG